MNEVDDFVIEEVKEVVIDDKTWKIKPVTAGDENEWVGEYVEPVTKVVNGVEVEVYEQNLTKLNECLLRNVVGIPYSDETVQKVLGTDKTWVVLNKKERLEFLNKLKPGIYSKVIKSIKN